jgi:hypothetical protein
MSTGGRKENSASTKDMHYVSGSTAANFELRKSISASSKTHTIFPGTKCSLRVGSRPLAADFGSLPTVQLLLGRTKLESTVRYLGIEVDDALEMAEQTEV